MMANSGKHLPAGTRVRVTEPGDVPSASTWDDDKQRTSTSVKKRLQQMFFRADRRITAEIVYVSSESVRAKLKTKGLTKVQVRDQAGSELVITAETDNLRAA